MQYNDDFKLLCKSSKDFLKFIKPVKLSDWCDENRVIADGASSEPGMWRTSRTPYMRGIMDAVTDPNIHEIVVCASVQVGKTELLLNTICYYMQHEPTTMLLLEPSEDLVVDIGVDRIDSMIKVSPKLRKLFNIKDDKKASKKKSNIKNDIKRFPGGYLKLASAASPSALKSRSIRVVLCDEIDIYPLRPDGHPVDMARGRATNFNDYKILMTSSPTTAQGSEIWRRLNTSSRYEYKIPCPGCGAYNTWKWENVKWHDDNPETAFLICPDCGEVLRGAGVAPNKLLNQGKWELVEGFTKSDKIGFQISCLYSPWKKLSELVTEFLDATHSRNIDRLRTFIQERLAEPWEERPNVWNYNIDEVTQSRRFEKYPDHKNITVITAGVDIQADRIEISFWGWSVNRESWIIEHCIIEGDTQEFEVYDKLRKKLILPIELSDGRKMRAYAVCVDSGDGATTNIIYQFTKPLEKINIISVKGRGGENVPIFSPPKRQGAVGALLIVLGVDRIKAIISDRLNIPIEGAGYIHIPELYKGKFWKQLNSEVLDEVIENNKTVKRWRKIHERNEALDCYVYATAAFELFAAKLQSIIKK